MRVDDLKRWATGRRKGETGGSKERVRTDGKISKVTLGGKTLNGVDAQRGGEGNQLRLKPQASRGIRGPALRENFLYMALKGNRRCTGP